MIEKNLLFPPITLSGRVYNLYW